MLKALLVFGLFVCAAPAVSCTASDAAVPGDATSTMGPASTASVSTPTGVPASPTPAPPATPVSPLTGFSFPLTGGCLPSGDQLMPNAPRPYRDGIHEGIDFYDVDNCTRIAAGTEVLAAKPGRVVRADLDYRDMTREELSAYLANPTTDEAVDKFRGRQVWLVHDGGIVTRYAHLSGVAPGIVAGSTVLRGQVVGYVGESGTPESITNPGHQYHLHFEVRVGDGFLGKGLPAAEVRRLYRELFAAQP